MPTFKEYYFVGRKSREKKKNSFNLIFISFNSFHSPFPTELNAEQTAKKKHTIRKASFLLIAKAFNVVEQEKYIFFFSSSMSNDDDDDDDAKCVNVFVPISFYSPHSMLFWLTNGEEEENISTFYSEEEEERTE